MKQRMKVELTPGNEGVLVDKLFGKDVPTEYMVRKNPRTIVHNHTYGGLTPFFKGLSEGKLFGTRCDCPKCAHTGIWLPPRVHCPDCWREMAWQEIDTSEATVYSFSITNLPGAGFKLTTPCPLISVDIPGVCTKFMSYLSEFAADEPCIGMKVRPVFRTNDPTYSILDISWVPQD